MGSSTPSFSIAGGSFQPYLIMTQRNGLYVTGTVNGTLETLSLGKDVVTLESLGTTGVKVTKSFSNNLWGIVISPQPFTISV